MFNLARMRRYLPLIYFLILVLLIWLNLGKDPNKLPSALINQAVPSFDLPTLNNPKNHFTDQDLKGQVSLLHVWASWCGACSEEQPFLVEIANKHNIKIFGLNYKDSLVKAKHWLEKYGDPFTQSGMDSEGRVAINLGVYGTPETFVVDSFGIIRHRHVGPMGPTAWQEEIYPVIAKLNNEQYS